MIEKSSFGPHWSNTNVTLHDAHIAVYFVSYLKNRSLSKISQDTMEYGPFGRFDLYLKGFVAHS